MDSFLEQYPNYFRYKTRTTEGYEHPAATRNQSVEVNDSHTLPVRNIYTHKNQWNTYELEVTPIDVKATHIDWRGNAKAWIEEIAAVDSAAISYRLPPICDPRRYMYWLINCRVSRFIRSQPLFSLMLVLSWIAVFMSFNAAIRKDKPVDVFRGSTYVLVVALFLHFWLVLTSCCKDMRWCWYSQRGCCRGRCRASPNTEWLEYHIPPPRVGGTWTSSQPHRINAVLREHTLRNEGPSRVDAKEVYDAAQEARAQWEEDERARLAEYERKRGGGSCCGGISLRTLVFLIYFLVFALGALTSCGIAMDWTYYKGKSDKICFADEAKWWYDFSCDYFDEEKYCKHAKAHVPPGGKGSNRDLAFKCPAGVSALDSVIQSHAEGAPDTTCGLCKSAFMPSYRACESLKLVYAVILLLTLFTRVAPQLPVRIYVYEPTPSAVLHLLSSAGEELMRCDLGDIRNAKAAMNYLLIQRDVQRRDYLRAGHRGYTMLAPPRKGAGILFHLSQSLTGAAGWIGVFIQESLQFLFFGA